MSVADRPVRPRASRAAEAREAVKRLILDRGLGVGDPLPTESELMKELGISRNSVREALKALQAVGIVEIRHGFGMFVGRMSLGGLVDELAFHGRITPAGGGHHLAHLVQVREALESGLVIQLIERHREADLSAAADVLDQMDAEARLGAVSPETDRRFHDVLYLPLRNPLVGQLLGAFWDVYHQLRLDLGAPTEPPREVVRRHRVIHNAVAAGDKQAAVTAVQAHFDGVRGRLARLRGC
ncbi:FadR/GntR family transcriptional regulator [Micromonospora deserti]|uniref:GntR family transcriptional regulator n=1 Tax=Micromonospora deserti TaxID=2070366 RepID=A0A2W2CKL6_9ACTN|nr:FadR/GntR family transcriptional regulator [Micromonospora deserti]PZG00022.1 GntR family transcriptional regulator [Micromonospora deserti]